MFFGGAVWQRGTISTVSRQYCLVNKGTAYDTSIMAIDVARSVRSEQIPKLVVVPPPARGRTHCSHVAIYVEVCESRQLLSADPPNTLSITGPSAPVDVGSSVTCNGAFSDSDMAMHSFTEEWNVTGPGLPAGGTNGTGSSITFTPTAAGNFTITYTVTDNDDGETSDPTTYDVVAAAPAGANALPPVLAAVADQTNNEGDAVSLAVSGADPGGYTLTYSAASLPSGVTIDSASGLISGTIGQITDGGQYTVVVTAADPYGSATQSFSWVVNRHPTAVLTGPSVLNIGEPLDLDGSASSDPDPGATLSYAWDVDGSGAFAISTGQVAALSREYWDDLYNLNYLPATWQTIGLKVTDSHGLSATATMQLFIDGTNSDPAGSSEPDLVETFDQATAPNVDFTFLVPQNAAANSVVGTVPLNADTFVIVAGNGSGTFAIDNAGVLTVAGPLNPQYQESYLLTIEAADSTTGATTSATVAVLVDSGQFVFFQQAPQQIAAGTIITQLGGKDIKPIRFGDLPQKFKDALQNPGRYVITMHDQNGGYFITDLTQGAPKFFIGPKSLSNAQVQWEMKISAVQAQSNGYMYKTVFRLDPFYASLKTATANLLFNVNPDPETAPTYDSITGHMNVNNVRTTELHTVIHESIHVLDANNGWYLPNLTFIQKAEALGWTGQHMLTGVGVLPAFRDIENSLNNPMTTADTLNHQWYGVVRGLNGLFSDVIRWKVGVIERERTVTSADIQDFMAKTGVDFAVAKLMNQYQQKANAKGIPYTFSLTNVMFTNSPQISVPTVFRH